MYEQNPALLSCVVELLSTLELRDSHIVEINFDEVRVLNELKYAFLQLWELKM